MSESKFTSIYPPRRAPVIRPVSTDLRTCTEEVVPVVGSANITLGYGSSTHVLPLLIVRGEGPAPEKDLLRMYSLRLRLVMNYNQSFRSDANRVSNSDAG